MVKLRFLKGNSSLNVKDTRKLTRIVKEAICSFSNAETVESFIVQEADYFLKIIEIRYYTTAPGVRLRLGGSDTGKEVYAVRFINDTSRRLHWIFIRGLKPEEHDTTIFYNSSSSDE